MCGFAKTAGVHCWHAMPGQMQPKNFDKGQVLQCAQDQQASLLPPAAVRLQWAADTCNRANDPQWCRGPNNDDGDDFHSFYVAGATIARCNPCVVCWPRVMSLCCSAASVLQLAPGRYDMPCTGVPYRGGHLTTEPTFEAACLRSDRLLKKTLVHNCTFLVIVLYKESTLVYFPFAC